MAAAGTGVGGVIPEEPGLLDESGRTTMIDGFASAALAAARVRDAELTRTRPTPAAAFRAARRIFLSGRRLDMGELANDLGISRATLYRWTGDRDQLLSDVLWSLSDEIFEQAKKNNPEHIGSDRLLAIYRHHVGALVQARPLQLFLQQETYSALRILTSSQSTVQRRTVLRLAQLYEEEKQAGVFVPKTDVETLAYAVVRLTEAFIYNDSILAVVPEMERAAAVVALLLGAD